MRTTLFACALISLSGCASGQAQPKLPYNAWFAGLGAPERMEVWVESLDVIDRRGLAYKEVYSGIVSYTGST